MHVVPHGQILLYQAEFRIAAITLLAYHYLSTMGAEWRFAFRQRQKGQYTAAFILFLLVRYLSLLDIISSQISYFSGTAKSELACSIWIYEIRYVRLMASAVSSLILSWRAWVICLKSRKLAYSLAAFLAIVVIVPMWTESYISLFIGDNGECWAGNPHQVYGVIYYCVNLVYDAFLVFISTRQLWQNAVTSGVLHAFSASLMKEGLWYFVVVTAFNVLNIILWSLPASTGSQTLGANIGVAINSMMSQGIILNLQEVTVPREQSSRPSNDHYSGNRNTTNRGSRWQSRASPAAPSFLATQTNAGRGTHASNTDVRVAIETGTWVEDGENSTGKHTRQGRYQYHPDQQFSEKTPYTGANSDVELSPLPSPHNTGYAS